MRKPAKPGHEFDVKTGARAQVVRDETRPARTEGTFGMADRDGFSDEVNLSDAWLVEHARHGDHQAFAVLVRPPCRRGYEAARRPPVKPLSLRSRRPLRHATPSDRRNMPVWLPGRRSVSTTDRWPARPRRTPPK